MSGNYTSEDEASKAARRFKRNYENCKHMEIVNTAVEA